jgi:hypothetical protein
MALLPLPSLPSGLHLSVSGQCPLYPFLLDSTSQCRGSGPSTPSISSFWTPPLGVRSMALISLLSLPSRLHLSVSGQWPFYPFYPFHPFLLDSSSQCQVSGPSIPYIWPLSLSVMWHVSEPSILFIWTPPLSVRPLALLSGPSGLRLSGLGQ